MRPRIPELPEPYVFASHVDGRYPHPPVYGEALAAYYCNCKDCCMRRMDLRGDWRWPNPYGMIAVRTVWGLH